MTQRMDRSLWDYLVPVGSMIGILATLPTILSMKDLLSKMVPIVVVAILAYIIYSWYDDRRRLNKILSQA